MSKDVRGGFQYQPALDGLRAVAVLAVIAYHLGYGWARGGFLGVDAFFVLSGYLITSLLLVEFGSARRIDLRAFWARRARRLLPALLLVLGAVTVWAAVVLRPDQLGNLRGDGLSTLFYGANWRFVASGQSYFDVVSAVSPLRHAWSLAIEEQFYLVWPLVVCACLWLARGRTRLLATLCVAGAAASIVLMAVLYDPVDPSRAYYGTDTRAHALLIGALLAIVLRRRAERAERITWRSDASGGARPARAWFGLAPAQLLQAVGIGAAIACVAAFALVPDSSAAMYHGGFALFAVAVAALVAASVAPGPSPLRSVLSFRPLRWIGMISYGLYLWHWPVQVALTAPRTGIDGVTLDVVRVATTFALATLSFYLVERPIRHGVLGRRAYVATPLAFAGVVSAVLLVAATAVPPPAYLRNNGDTSIATALHGLDGHRPAAGPTDAVATSPVPATDAAPAAPPTPAAPTAAAAPVTFAAHRLLLVGDSVMASLQPSLRTAAAAAGVDLATVAVPGCGTIAGEPLGPGDARYSWTAGCGRNVPGLQTSAVTQDRPDLVVWLSSWEGADRIVGDQTVRIETASGFQTIYDLVDQAVQRLTSTGARVAFLTMPPQASADDVAEPSPELQARYRLMDELLEWYVYRHPATTFVVDLSAKVCPGGSPCPQVVDGVRPRPIDGHHFSSAGGAWIAPWIVAQLAAPRVLPARN